MKKRNILLLSIAFIVGLAFSGLFQQEVQATELPTGEPIVVYGANLTADQKEQVQKLLEVEDTDKETEVSGADIAHYIDGDPNSNMFSSVKIIPQDDGYGIVVDIVTADNITQVTSEMYSNAMLTAGVENALVVVAAPKPVTGHSALTGIYKAYDEGGAELDKDRMEVANEELSVTTDLAEKAGIDAEKVAELMTEIKREIAEKDPATREDIEEIIKEQLDKLEISLSEEDRQLLIDLFEKMRELNIDFDKVRNQLEDLASTIKDKIGELDIDIDEGFWEKVANFFRQLIDDIIAFFQ